jgi:hypothetical protein
MRGKIKLTKLQQEYIEISTPHGSFVAYPNNIFQSDNYLKWRRKRRTQDIKEQNEHSTQQANTAMPGICAKCRDYLKPCTRPGVLQCYDFVPAQQA